MTLQILSNSFWSEILRSQNFEKSARYSNVFFIRKFKKNDKISNLVLGKDQQWKVAAVGPEDADSAMVQKDSAYEIGDSLEAIGERVEKTYGKSSFVEISPHGHELETDAASMLQVESEVE